MSHPKQPDVQVLIIEETDLNAAFGTALSKFEYMNNKATAAGAFYVAAHRDGDLVGLAKMYSYPDNEYLAFVEVDKDNRQQGISRVLRNAAFDYAQRHTGKILLSTAQGMGAEHLPRQTEELQKIYPSLTILRQQNG